MSDLTSNLGLTKDGPNDYYDKERDNDNLDKLDAAVGDVMEVKTAGGTATAISLTIPSITEYKANHKISFIAATNNSGAATTINVNGLGEKNIYKPNTTAAPNLIAGKLYDAWYSQTGSCYFLKASAEGTAVAADVLAGKTFSNDEDTGLTGSIQSKGAEIFTPGISDQVIASGKYLSGNQTVKGDINLISENIKEGITIFGVIGALLEPLKNWANTFYRSTPKDSGTLFQRQVITGSGWVISIGDFGAIRPVALKIDGTFIIGDATHGFNDNHGYPVMQRYESGFELWASSGEAFAVYVEGDVFEEATPRCATGNPQSSITTERLNVSGSGWLFNISQFGRVADMKLVVDGTTVLDFEDFTNDIHLMYRFETGFVMYSEVDYVDVSYVLD